MQFHFNGFKSGDPRLANARSEDLIDQRLNDGDQVDVLIVGSGPAGLALGAYLSQYDDLSISMVEAKDGPIRVGQADGVACRTMETFEALGFAHRILEEAYWVNEIAFWTPDSKNRDRVSRDRVIDDTEPGLSEFPHVILNQARVHDYLLEKIRHSPSGFSPNYRTQFISCERDDQKVHPIKVRLQQEDESFIYVETQFLVGCDGAHSRVKDFLGVTFSGDRSDKVWGVMDILCSTNFPDVRRKSIIKSDRFGTLLIIPREGGYMIRLYIELDLSVDSEMKTKDQVTPKKLIEAANRIIAPYEIVLKEVAWWSAYEIGQRVADRFDDYDECETNRFPRLFIAGDACHTHSPKAGQGMNVSLQDGFNLGWKLGAVLNNHCSTEILKSYSDERQSIASQLIEFDRVFSRIFGGGATNVTQSLPSEQHDFQSYFVQHGRYTAGVETCYQQSQLIGSDVHQGLAKGFPVGKRFQSEVVTRFADSKPVHLAHEFKFDGRWRIVVFCPASNFSKQLTILSDLSRSIFDVDKPMLSHLGCDPSRIDDLIDFRFVLEGGPADYCDTQFPILMQPEKGNLQLTDYEKILCSQTKSGVDIFCSRQIDRQAGCLVIVRPDQHVAGILPLAQFREMTAFFEQFMMIRK